MREAARHDGSAMPAGDTRRTMLPVGRMADRTAPAHTTDVFVHIPKTAGSTIRTLLSCNYPMEQSQALSGRPDNTLAFLRRPRAAVAHLRLIHGHHPVGLRAHFGLWGHDFTFLREPLARLFSDYFYAARDPAHNLHDEVASGALTALDFARLAEREPYFDNLMTQYLSGTLFLRPGRAALDEAKRVLEHKIAAFGLAERFDESVLLLSRRLGWHQPFYVRKNVSRRGLVDLDPAAVDAAREWSRLDAELHAFATSLFETRVEAAGDALSEAHAALVRVEHRLHADFGLDDRRLFRTGQDVEDIDGKLAVLAKDSVLAKDIVTVRRFIGAESGPIVAPVSLPGAGPDVGAGSERMEEPDGAGAAGEGLERLDNLITAGAVDLVSVDVFDTLLLRTTKPEIARFRSLAGHLRRALAETGVHPLPGRDDLFVARLDAARAAYREAPREGPAREAHVDTIYALMLRALGLPADHATVLRESEIAWETQGLGANMPLLAALGRAKTRGIRVIYASDMYLDTAAIDRLIAAACADPGFDARYSSAESGLSKRTGTLFGLIERETGIEPRRAVHLGDSAEGDVAHPAARGWHAIHLPRSRIWQTTRALREALYRARLLVEGLSE